MDRRCGACCTAAMWRPLPPLALLFLLGACGWWRPAPPIAVAPDPVVYPAPALEGRYMPWINPQGR